MSGDRPTNVDEKIGKILGILEPIPGHINNLFSKIDSESRERISGDGLIKSDLKLLEASVVNLQKNIEAYQSSQQEEGSRSEDILLSIEKDVKDLSERVRDLTRVLSMSEGQSVTLSSILVRLVETERQLKTLIGERDTVWGFFKGFGGHLVTILVTLLIAYLAMKLGLKP